jgi:two-component system CheB/CheR fusion protein
VVLTFTDITKRVEAEAVARGERELAERVVATVREPLLVLDGGLRVISASRSFHDVFGTTPESSKRRLVFELGERRLDIPALRELLEHVLPEGQGFERFPVEVTTPDGSTRRLHVDGRRIVGTGPSELILLAFER